MREEQRVKMQPLHFLEGWGLGWRQVRAQHWLNLHKFASAHLLCMEDESGRHSGIFEIKIVPDVNIFYHPFHQIAQNYLIFNYEVL